jgi:hypothetical protein
MKSTVIMTIRIEKVSKIKLERRKCEMTAKVNEEAQDSKLI